MDKKEYKDAEDMLNALLKNNDPMNLAEAASINTAMDHLMMGTHQYRKAIGFLEKVLNYDRQSGFHRGLADLPADIGSAYQKPEKYPSASYYYQRSIKFRR